MKAEKSFRVSKTPSTVIAKSGQPVLLIDGRATASLVDPVAEAKAWIESVKPSIPKPAETIVVLGVGSGFHIQLLRSSYQEARLIAVDSCPFSLEFTAERGVDNVSFVSINVDKIHFGPEDFLNAPDVSDWILEPYTLLPHRATMARNRELAKVENWLIGRSSESFRAQLELRPNIAAILNPGRLKEVTLARMNSNSVFSVRDLTACCDIKGEPSVERRILRVLEELVR